MNPDSNLTFADELPRPLHESVDRAADVIRRLEVVELALDGLAESTLASGLGGLRDLVGGIINDADVGTVHDDQRNDPMLDEMEALTPAIGRNATREITTFA